MARFEVTTDVRPAHVVVALAGECDMAGRDELTSALLAAVQRATVVLVDMARLMFIDSSGLHGLISAHHAALEAGGRVYVVNAAGAVARLLDLTGVGELLRPPADAAGRDA
jgi:anti-sigma B factor antagonist